MLCHTMTYLIRVQIGVQFVVNHAASVSAMKATSWQKWVTIGFKMSHANGLTAQNAALAV
jgi:hypothetical protein